MKLILSPHNDDVVLFATFTLLRESPHIAVVLDSYVQVQRGHADCTPEVRRREDSTALVGVLGCRDLSFLGFRDDQPDWNGIKAELQHRYQQRNDIDLVYAPFPEINGHDHHNRVGEIAHMLWPGRVKFYTTYTNKGKSRGVFVPYQPEWVLLKLRALACYETQVTLDNCCEHFLRDQFEYYAS
jgi:LmbE family N-acetylglucosaminyl deacetylase